MPRITEQPTDTMVARHEPTTLNCKADGVPEPNIEWYKDGELIATAGGGGGGGGESHRVLLPTGSLFFLRVTHGRKDSDQGIYWCLARNQAGFVRSRNATLDVASTCSVISVTYKVVGRGTRYLSNTYAPVHVYTTTSRLYIGTR